MRNSFPFPLPESALEEFTFPGDYNELSRPLRDGRHIFAANSLVALRAHKGAWIDEEFESITEEARKRLQSLPWGRLEAVLQDQEWAELDKVRSRIFKRPIQSMFLERRDNGYTPNPCPVWRVKHARVRLSVLQHVAKLPRAEVYLQHTRADGALFFRFSGGVGIIAPDRRLKQHSQTIFAPRYCPLGGHEI